MTELCVSVPDAGRELPELLHLLLALRGQRLEVRRDLCRGLEPAALLAAVLEDQVDDVPLAGHEGEVERREPVGVGPAEVQLAVVPQLGRLQDGAALFEPLVLDGVAERVKVDRGRIHGEQKPFRRPPSKWSIVPTGAPLEARLNSCANVGFQIQSGDVWLFKFFLRLLRVLASAISLLQLYSAPLSVSLFLPFHLSDLNESPLHGIGVRACAPRSGRRQARVVVGVSGVMTASI